MFAQTERRSAQPIALRLPRARQNQGRRQSADSAGWAFYLQPQQIAPARQISEGIEVDEEDLIFVNQSAEGKQVELSLRRNQE